MSFHNFLPFEAVEAVSAIRFGRGLEELMGSRSALRPE